MLAINEFVNMSLSVAWWRGVSRDAGAHCLSRDCGEGVAVISRRGCAGVLGVDGEGVAVTSQRGCAGVLGVDGEGAGRACGVAEGARCQL